MKRGEGRAIRQEPLQPTEKLPVTVGGCSLIRRVVRRRRAPLLNGMVRAVLVLLLLAAVGIVHAEYRYTESWISVPVDHFSFSNNASFKMRYLINDTFWQPEINAPIFFYTGNEGDITMFAENTGFLWETAIDDFAALIVFAEHRYYGKSLPYGNESFSDPQRVGYLTSQQALADYVDLVNYLQANLSSPVPVIAFGGSYGGMLAAYFRMKYPHIVQGAIAASAPIFQFPGLVPCGIFNIIVTSDYNVTSNECMKSIQKSWKILDTFAASDLTRKWLNDKWKLCKPLNKTDDILVLKAWLTDLLVNVAMVNYPYPSNFLAPLPAYPIKAMCKNLPNSSYDDKTLLLSLFKAISVYTNYTKKSHCTDIQEDASPKLGEMGWDFQACTEMVMPICSNDTISMFEEEEWNLKKFSDDCYKKWKVRPQPGLAIETYGGKDISATTNIVFSNGLLDPWAGGGVLRNYSDSLVAVLIPEGAHHLDLRAKNSADPVSVVKAREFHKHYIQQWIKQFYRQHKIFPH